MNNKKILFIVAVVLITLQSWFIYVTLQYPPYGILAELNADRQWEVTGLDVVRDKVSLDVKVGDVIYRIDGLPVGEHSTLRYGVVEQFSSLEILRDGNVVSVDVQHIPSISRADIFGLAGEIISLTVAVIILIKVPYSQSARLLSLVFIFIGIAFMGFGSNFRADVIGKMVVVGSVIAIPLTFVHFLLTFFKEKGGIRYPKLPIKYIVFPPYGIFLLGLPTVISHDYGYFVHRNWGFFHGLPIFFGVGMIFYILTNAYIHHYKKGTYESTIIRTIWIMLCISLLPFVVLTLIPQILFDNTKGYVSPLITGWFVMLFPISFAYLLATRQLYDIPHVVRRVLYVTIMSLLPSVVLVSIVALFDSAISFSQLGMMFVLFMTILSIVFYSLEYFGLKLEPIVFPRKYQLQNSIKQVAKNLGSSSSFRDLKDMVLSNIVDTLQVTGGAIVMQYKEDIQMICDGRINEEEVKGFLENTGNLSKKYSCFEINRHEDYTSYLILTEKTTNTMITREETQWIHLIVAYLAVSLENVELIRKLTMKLEQLAAQFPNEKDAKDLNWFRKMMFEFQEKERQRIATDLHDTTMQDLFFLKQRFRSLLEPYPLEPQDQSKAQEIIDFIEIININLRQSCFELNPYLLKEIGLVATVEKLVDLEKSANAYDISFVYRGKEIEILERLDMEIKRHMFRLVQELLNNASKHSQASKVKIELLVTGSYIELNYTDDGVGFNPDQPVRLEIGRSGIGMEQLKSRVYALNGRYQLESGVGQGVRFRMTFPFGHSVAV